MKNLGTLAVSLPSDTEVQMARIFDAPKPLVFRAMTEPELVKRWFGPRGHHLVTCEIDFREGGDWRYVVRAPNGSDMGMHGKYLEIEPNERIVHTEAFDEYPMSSTVTTTFVEHAGKTTLTITVRAASKEIRDAVVQSGMEHGAAETFDKLADMLVAQAGATPEAVTPAKAGAHVQKITTFLWFDNQAEEAMKFYVSVFKNSKVVSASQQSVTCELEGQRFMALNGGPQFKFTPAISLFVNCDGQAEVDEMWDKFIANGGKPGRCGWLEDRWGLSWQIIPSALGRMLGSPDRAAADRAIKAMLGMSRIDIAAMETAFKGN